MDIPPALAVFTEVRLPHSIAVYGQLIPEGTAGVVVASYEDGLAYEIDFEAPFAAVLTLKAADGRTGTVGLRDA